MTSKRKPVPTDIASESALGEEDPGAALEMSMSEPAKPTQAPEGKPSPDTPLESPMPRSPTLDREEPPKLAAEEDIAPEDDAPSSESGEKSKRRAKLKKPAARGSGAGRNRG